MSAAWHGGQGEDKPSISNFLKAFILLSGIQSLTAFLEILTQSVVSKVMETCPPQIWFLPIQGLMISSSMTWLSMDPHGQGWGMA